MTDAALRWSRGWAHYEDKVAPIPLELPSSSGIILSKLAFHRQSSAEDDKSISVDIDFGKQRMLDLFSIQSNARFIELYVDNGKGLEYVETCRGAAEPTTPNVFAVTLRRSMRAQTIRLKFASIKGSDPSRLNIDAVAVRFIDLSNSSCATTAPATAGGAQGNNTGIDSTQLFGLVEVVKASLLADMSRLLDSKLGPVMARLNQLDDKLSILSETVCKRFPAADTPLDRAEARLLQQDVPVEEDQIVDTKT
jgi:hypothetical protein